MSPPRLEHPDPDKEEGSAKHWGETTEEDSTGGLEESRTDVVGPGARGGWLLGWSA